MSDLWNLVREYFAANPPPHQSVLGNPPTAAAHPQPGGGGAGGSDVQARLRNWDSVAWEREGGKKKEIAKEPGRSWGAGWNTATDGEVARKMEKLRGFHELARECVQRGVDADEGGLDLQRAANLYSMAVDVVEEAMKLDIRSPTADVQRMQLEMREWSSAALERLQVLRRHGFNTERRGTGGGGRGGGGGGAAQKGGPSEAARQGGQTLRHQSANGWGDWPASRPACDGATWGWTVNMGGLRDQPPQQQPPLPPQQRTQVMTMGDASASGGLLRRPAAAAGRAAAPVAATRSSQRAAGADRRVEAGRGVRQGREGGSAAADALKSVDAKLVEMIEREIVDERPSVQWDDIAGLEAAKQALQEMVIFPTLRQDLFQGIRRPARGLLLFGPPGTGKTMLARAVASQARATFFNVSAASLTSKWMGEGEKLVRALFAVAVARQPSVIFIDEIDSILSERSQGEHEASRRLKTEFLVQFDGVLAHDDAHVVVMGATNRPQELDEAARRRLVKRIYIPLPDGKARRTLVRHLTLSSSAFILSDGDISEIVESTKGYSGSDLKALCQEAAMAPIRELGVRIASVPANDVRKARVEDFRRALLVIRPSVDSSSLSTVQDWARQYASCST